MTARLFDHPLAGIDQDERDVRVRRPGHHVARVLGVARGVGDDELALWRGEIAVGHVDGDALLALGPQPVGEQRQVGLGVARAARSCGGSPRAGPRRSPWRRRAAGRSASTCRRRPSRPWPGAGARPSEVPLPLAVLHAGLRDPVVGPGGAPLGQSGPRHLGDHQRRSSRRWTRRTRCSRRRPPCGSAPRPRSRLAVASGPRCSVTAMSMPSRWNTCAPVGVVDATARRCAPRRCSSTRRARSSWRAGRPGCARPCCGDRCRGSTARGVGSWGPTGRTRHGS